MKTKIGRCVCDGGRNGVRREEGGKGRGERLRGDVPGGGGGAEVPEERAERATGERGGLKKRVLGGERKGSGGREGTSEEGSSRGENGEEAVGGTI